MATEIDERTAVVTDSRCDGPPPRHVGIIMDGNGRWAAARGLPRVEGHRRGVEAVRRMVRAAIEIGISYVTIYSFSAENWSRPVEEVADLMGLLKRFIRNDLADLHRIGVRVKIIGSRKGLAPDICRLLDEAEEITRDNRCVTLIVAFNYGSRQEIAEAARRVAERVIAGEVEPADINADMLASHLATAGIPDPDLIIRTSGEQRLSNFLMWQAAYSEFVFLPIHWPEFDRQAFENALAEFAARERRFGGVRPVRTVKTGS
jgi:undecaprenyl diphosphate synthase